MSSERYQGHANYETWAIKLWLDNEEPSYQYWRERTREIVRHPTYQNEFMPEDRRVVYELAESLKAHYEELAEQWMGDQASAFADLFNHALGKVEWLEIAEDLIRDYEP